MNPSHHHHHYHHIRFNACFPWSGRFLIRDFQAFLHLDKSLLTFDSFTPGFFGCPLRILPITLTVLQLLDRALSSVLSRWSNHCSLLCCKHFLMLFNLSSPKFLCRNPILMPNIAHASNYPCIIPLLSNQLLLIS